MTSYRLLPGAVAAPEPPHVEDDGDVSIARVWAVLMRRRWLVSAVALFATLAAGFIAALTVAEYRSGATVRIDSQNSGLPVLDVLQKIGAGTAQEIFTEMEVLRSRRLAESVVEGLRLQLSAQTPFRVTQRPFFVAAPRTVEVSSFADSVSVAPTARSASWKVHRTAAGSFTFVRLSVDSLVRTPAKASGRTGDIVDLGGVTLRLAAGARELPDFDLQLLDFESAVRQLRDGLEVSRAQRDANIVSIAFQSADPTRARDVPNALAAAFLEFRNKGIKTEARSTVEFLRGQLDLLQVQLASAEERLKSFREKAQTVDLTTEATSQVGELARLRADRDAKEGERAALAKLLNDAAHPPAGTVDDGVSPYRKLVAFPTLLSSPAATFLASLNTLENERAVMRQTRTASAADVLSITGRIKALEEQLRSITFTYVQGLNSQVAVLDSSIARFQSMVKLVPAKEMEFARLDRETQVLSSLFTMLQTRLKEAEIAQAIEDPRVRIVDSALLPSAPVKPRMKLSLLLGLLLGLMGGVGLAFAMESMDKAIHTREEMSGLTGSESIGLIPHIGPLGVEKGIRRFLPKLPKRAAKRLGGGGTAVVARTVGDLGNRSAIMEAYRTLRTNLAFTNPDNPPRSIVFTSPYPGDGKSTTAANLAVVLAQQGRRVLLVDGDLRRGTLHQFFNNTPRTPGLSSILIGSATLEQCVVNVEMRDGSTVFFIPTGPLPPNPSELYSASRMDRFLEDAKASFDIVLFDSPPLNIVTDAAILGAKADGVVLIGRAGATHRMAVAYAADQLRGVRATLLGTVLNDFDTRHGYGYAYGYGYGYHYHYGQAYGYGSKAAGYFDDDEGPKNA